MIGPGDLKLSSWEEPLVSGPWYHHAWPSYHPLSLTTRVSLKHCISTALDPGTMGCERVVPGPGLSTLAVCGGSGGYVVAPYHPGATRVYVRRAGQMKEEGEEIVEV